MRHRGIGIIGRVGKDGDADMVGGSSTASCRVTVSGSRHECRRGIRILIIVSLHTR